MEMTCSQIKKILSDYLADNLSSEKKQGVAAHLASCEQCAGLLKAYENMIQEVRKVTPVSAPPDFLNKVKNRQKNIPFGRRLLQKLFVPLKIKIPVQVVTMTALGILVFLMLPYEKDRSPMMKTKPFQLPITEQKMSPAPVIKKDMSAIPEESYEKKSWKTTIGKSDENTVGTLGRPLELVLVVEKDLQKSEKPSTDSAEKDSPTNNRRKSPLTIAVKEGIKQEEIARAFKNEGTPDSASFQRHSEPNNMNTSRDHEIDLADEAGKLVSRVDKITDSSETTDTITQLVENTGGTVLKIHQETDTFHRICVRIPASQVSLLVARLAPFGYFRHPPPNSDDLKPGPSILEIMIFFEK